MDSSINIQTVVLPAPPKPATARTRKRKAVTFSQDPATIINDADSPEPEPLANDSDVVNGKSTVNKNSAAEEETTINCRKCKQNKKINIRMSLFLGSNKDKEKKSIFDVVLGWFEKLL